MFALTFCYNEGMRCLVCHNVLQPGARAIKPKYCSNRCTQKAHRLRLKYPVPVSMTDAVRWVRANGKKPLRVNGRNASSTNPDSWISYDNARTSSVGDGFGFMLGGGFAVYDFDHCFTDSGALSPDVSKMIRHIAEPVLFVEVSCSGDGLHVFVQSEARSYRRGGVEFYSRARFVRMTCCPFRGWEGVRADA